jgi:hypothetical protein
MGVSKLFTYNVYKREDFGTHGGTQTRFWEDLWIGTERLMYKFPSLLI